LKKKEGKKRLLASQKSLHLQRVKKKQRKESRAPLTNKSKKRDGCEFVEGKGGSSDYCRGRLEANE